MPTRRCGIPPNLFTSGRELGRFHGHGSTGDISFTCRLDGKLFHGYLLATTLCVQTNGHGICNVPELHPVGWTLVHTSRGWQ